MRRNRRSDPEDDGRVVAPMNVEGMPWYAPRADKKGGDKASEVTTGNANGGTAPELLTRKEKLAFAWGVLKAVMLVAAVFIAVYLGFILFCTEVWFK